MSRVRGGTGLLAGLAAACAVSVAAERPRGLIPASTPAQFVGLELDYADLNDANSAISLIDSGWQSSFGSRDRAEWLALYTARRDAVIAGLESAERETLDAGDTRARLLMRLALDDLPPSPESLSKSGRCADAPRRDIPLAQLQDSLYACFTELGNRLAFEGQVITRVGSFDLLTRMPEPERRKALFHSFGPLWKALHGASEPDSPYRRMIGAAAAEVRGKPTRVDTAAATVGATTEEIERWLVQVLEAWSRAPGPRDIEPWDYRYVHGAAEREIGPSITREQLQPLNERYYADLGADLRGWGVIYDLDPRPGKAPLAYTDYVRRGRVVDEAWQPTLVRISGNYGRGGLSLLNELVHENGHAAHMMALHARPAFMDLGDAVFFEAFADVPAWSLYEPAWQQKYLGRSASMADSLRSLHAGIMLDVAWALFDLRMLREPQRNPNEVWTAITQQYLHIKPYPELPWWAMRVQLVYSPGYMVNYGLGAVITADIRARIAQQIGRFDTGNARWYPWLTAALLSGGQEKETSVLLREFLGRPVLPQALLESIGRLGKTSPDQ